MLAGSLPPIQLIIWVNLFVVKATLHWLHYYTPKLCLYATFNCNDYTFDWFIESSTTMHRNHMMTYPYISKYRTFWLASLFKHWIINFHAQVTLKANQSSLLSSPFGKRFFVDLFFNDFTLIRSVELNGFMI